MRNFDIHKLKNSKSSKSDFFIDIALLVLEGLFVWWFVLYGPRGRVVRMGRVGYILAAKIALTQCLGDWKYST